MRIDSPKPSSDVEVNLLNIFYAVEWVVFAGFAIFLWYRLVRDAWEREQDESADAAGADRSAADAQPAHLN
jgi:surfeit locus 1 family protein